MKQGRLLLVFLSFLVSFALQAATLEGNWTSLDDKTGKKRAVINLQRSGETLVGTVVESFPDPGESLNCIHCPGAFKDKPIKGLEIIWGMKSKSEGLWEEGQILDPKSGKIYKAKLSLEGDKLHVRGYLGFSLIGRSQYWVR